MLNCHTCETCLTDLVIDFCIRKLNQIISAEQEQLRLDWFAGGFASSPWRLNVYIELMPDFII